MRSVREKSQTCKEVAVGQPTLFAKRSSRKPLKTSDSPRSSCHSSWMANTQQGTEHGADLLDIIRVDTTAEHLQDQHALSARQSEATGRGTVQFVMIAPPILCCVTSIAYSS